MENRLGGFRPQWGEQNDRKAKKMKGFKELRLKTIAEILAEVATWERGVIALTQYNGVIVISTHSQFPLVDIRAKDIDPDAFIEALEENGFDVGPLNPHTQMCAFSKERNDD